MTTTLRTLSETRIPKGNSRKSSYSKKVNETTILVRKTLNGKFKDPNWKASYCPDEAQRLYTEAGARDKAEAKQKAAEEKVRPNAQQSAKPAAEATAHNKAEAERKAREEEATLNPWRPQ